MNTPEAAEACEDLNKSNANKCHEPGFVIFSHTINKHPKIKPQTVKKQKWKNRPVKENRVRCVKGNVLDEFVYAWT
jgi:hypothetical protein